MSELLLQWQDVLGINISGLNVIGKRRTYKGTRIEKNIGVK